MTNTKLRNVIGPKVCDLVITEERIPAKPVVVFFVSLCGVLAPEDEAGLLE